MQIIEITDETTFTCLRCDRTFEDGIDAGQHEMWHRRKDEGERAARLLDKLPVGAEFKLAGVGPTYSATYRKNSEHGWDQVLAAPPLVRNFEAAHLGFCVGFAPIREAVESR